MLRFFFFMYNLQHTPLNLDFLFFAYLKLHNFGLCFTIVDISHKFCFFLGQAHI